MLTNRSSFPRSILLGCALLYSCAHYSTQVVAIDKDKLGEIGKIEQPTRVRLHDGSVVLCKEGVELTDPRLLRCPGGVRHDAQRTTTTEKEEIILDSIAGVERYQEELDVETTTVKTLGLLAIFAILLAALAAALGPIAAVGAL